MGTKTKAKPFDEMTLDDGGARNAYTAYAHWLDQTPMERLTRKHEQADIMFRRLGITFTVYGRDEGTERLIPFDVIPRILDAEEWDLLSRGVIQRVDAFNAFLHDIYHDQDILHAGKIPAELVLTNISYQPQMLSHDVARRVSDRGSACARTTPICSSLAPASSACRRGT